VQPLDSVPWNPRGYCNNIAPRPRPTGDLNRIFRQPTHGKAA
jgi:hypothetical protein